MQTLIFLFFIAIMPLWAATPPHWTSLEKKLYQRRHFIELEQRMISQGRKDIAETLIEQDRDLTGCRSVHEGLSSLTSLIECMRFMNRERELSLFIENQREKDLEQDLDLLCRENAKTDGGLKKIFLSHVLKAPKSSWSRCIHQAEVQLYLTTYANIRSQPAEALALYRLGLGELPSHFSEKNKIERLLSAR